MYVTSREVAPLPRRFTEAGFERTRCVVNIDVSKHDRARFRSQLSRIEIVYAYPRDIRGHAAPPLVVDFDLYKLKPYLELIGVGTSHSALMPIPSRLSKRDRIPSTETERQTGPLHKFPRCDKDSGSRENVNLRNIIDAHDSAKICDDGDVEDHASASHGHLTIKPPPPPPSPRGIAASYRGPASGTPLALRPALVFQDIRPEPRTQRRQARSLRGGSDHGRKMPVASGGPGPLPCWLGALLQFAVYNT